MTAPLGKLQLAATATLLAVLLAPDLAFADDICGITEVRRTRYGMDVHFSRQIIGTIQGLGKAPRVAAINAAAEGGVLQKSLDLEIGQRFTDHTMTNACNLVATRSEGVTGLQVRHVFRECDACEPRITDKFLPAKP